MKFNFIHYYLVIFFFPFMTPPVEASRNPAATHTITGKNLSALKSIPVKVFLPTKAPAGYEPFDFVIKNEFTDPELGHQNFSVLFLKDKSHWFLIESADTVGDADWENAKKTDSQSALFGKFSLQWKARTSPNDPIKTSSALTSWLVPLSEQSSLKNPSKLFRFYQIFGRGLSVDEMITLVKSLKLQN